jgi:hypothetical protein
MGIPFPEFQGREYMQESKTAKEELLRSDRGADFPKFRKLSGNPVDGGGEIPVIRVGIGIRPAVEETTQCLPRCLPFRIPFHLSHRSSAMSRGQISQIDYRSQTGTIRLDNGFDIPFSAHDLRPGTNMKFIFPNSTVEFSTVPGPRGPRPVNVYALPGPASAAPRQPQPTPRPQPVQPR